MQVFRSADSRGRAHEIVALFTGPVPEPGETDHHGRLLACFGNADDLSSLMEQRLAPNDRILELDAVGDNPSPTLDAEPIWLLVRASSEITDVRILVVEDSDMNGLYYQDVLSGAGAEVHRVSTGAETLDLIELHRFDLALVDVRLPDANGYELCQVLRSELDPDARILLMSADPTMLDSTRVTAVGASGFVINPIRPDELTRTVTAALDFDRANIIMPTVIGQDAISHQRFLRLLGRPAVWSARGWIDLPSGRSAEILATLAAACPHGVPAERLSELVWGRKLAISSNAMYTAISRLRRQLSDTILADAVVTEGLGYRLDAEPGSIDLVDFETRAKALMIDGNSNVDELRELLDLWTGNPFPGTGNDLLVNWRQRLHELRAQTIESLAARLTASGRASEAIGLCRDLVADEPWRESAWSLLIVALYRAGQAEDSLLAYRAAISQLREDLGLDPGPGLASLENKVLTHDPELLDDAWITQIAGGSLNRRSSAG
jgi:two-component SAPR family response regulator